MSNPIRMCINCRKRALQIDLIRLQYKDQKLINYTNFGRSFYLCKDCVDMKNKNLLKALSRVCKKEIKIIDLECLIHG